MQRIRPPRLSLTRASSSRAWEPEESAANPDAHLQAPLSSAKRRQLLAPPSPQVQTCFSISFHWFKEQAFVAGETTSLSNERRSRLALRIGRDQFSIASVAFCVWKSEHRHSDIGRAIIAQSRKAGSSVVRRCAGDEVSMMNATIAYNEPDPRARIALKCIQLIEIECVANLACYRMRVRQC